MKKLNIKGLESNHCLKLISDGGVDAVVAVETKGERHMKSLWITPLVILALLAPLNAGAVVVCRKF